MPTTTIANFFPKEWVYGEYEQSIFHDIQQQIDQRFSDQQNLLFNTTWRPQPSEDTEIQQFLTSGKKLDNLFVVSTVDYFLPHHCSLINEIVERTGAKHIYCLGNFDTPKPNWALTNATTIYFNFFAVVCRDYFEKYQIENLVLTDPKYLFISYNRKPYVHRLGFVKKLIEHNLKDLGIVTLGKSFPEDTGPDRDLYFSIGEKNEDYVKYGHWYTEAGTGHDIPHDLFSLHHMHYWKHHFFHIVGGTCPFNNSDQFINQIDFKPIIGLRPFLINGQTKNYKFWQDNGFKTFDHYFPGLKLDASPLDGQETLNMALIGAIKQLSNMTQSEILDLYNDMLPALLHNQHRWYEWADEQKYQVEHLFK